MSLSLSAATLQVAAGCCQIFFILTYLTTLSVSHMLPTGSRRWRDARIASIKGDELSS
jgi:hypothetical protein